VLLDGIDVRKIRLDDLRGAVSTVFEETFLFEGTVRDNIAFADPNASMERVRRAAELAGAHDFVSDLPGGYDSLVGGRGRSLSGGQRQRLALARAILPEPRVLILDDVMSAVDPSKEAQMRDALRSVIGGRTTILIAHRAATIRLADRVVLLDRGRIAATGDHDELMESSSLYRRVLAAPDRPHESAMGSAGPDGGPNGSGPNGSGPNGSGPNGDGAGLGADADIDVTGAAR
jgi:ATP-binding cassette, subfamily B, bacterial